MAKVFVVYDTKYGNTKLVAETIVEGMKEAKGIETSLGACMHALVIGQDPHVLSTRCA